MTAILTFFFVLVLVGGPVVGAAAYIVHVMKERHRAWSEVAAEFGLEIAPHGLFTRPTMSGVVDGVRVRVETTLQHHEISTTRFSVMYPRRAASPSMELTPAKNLNFTRRANGSIELGDENFDKAAILHTVDVTGITDYLTEDRRQTVLHLFGRKTWSDQRITADSIAVSTELVDEDRELLRSTITTLLHAAKLMSDDGEPILPAYEPGPLDVVADAEPELIETPTAPPADETHIERTGPIENANQPDASPAAHTPMPLPLDQGAVMHDLFDSDRMGFELDAHFAANYDGQHVEWNGEVDTVRTFSSDRDFTGAGAKVTVLLGHLRGETLRSREVKAVVQLPADTSVERGDTITLAGTLVRADRFTNSVYVADAQVR